MQENGQRNFSLMCVRKFAFQVRMLQQTNFADQLSNVKSDDLQSNVKVCVVQPIYPVRSFNTFYISNKLLGKSTECLPTSVHRLYQVRM